MLVLNQLAGFSSGIRPSLFGFPVPFSARMTGALRRTPTSGSEDTRFVLFTWLKLATLGTQRILWMCGTGGTNLTLIYLNSSDILSFELVHSSNSQASLQSTQVFRDTTAWGQLVVSYDSNVATASDRVQVFCNGVRITMGSTNPAQFLAAHFGAANEEHSIGPLSNYLSTQYPEMYMAQSGCSIGKSIQNGDFTIGSFGTFNYATGQWAPVDVSGLSLGTNGWFVNFEDGAFLGVEGKNAGLVMPNVGTAIGDMTSHGGLIAAFDKNYNGKTTTGGAAKASRGYIGKDWGSGDRPPLGGPG